MADSTSTPSTSNNASTVSHSSCFLRTVCLYDWWLIKAENDFQGKWLAVSGITSRKEKALRVFVSAAVTKRYDIFSLETADGINIIIRGFINEQRTLENGFSPEVFNNFIFGFPPNWENYAVDWFRDESTTAIYLGSAVPENVSTIDPKTLTDGVENSAPTSSKSPEEASRDHVKPLPKDECHASKETRGGVSGSNRRRTRSHDIEILQQKQPASGAPPKHPDEKQQSSLGALETRDGEGLKSPAPPAQSQSLGQENTPSELLIKNLASAIDPDILSDGVYKSISTSLESPEEASGNHEKPFSKDECHAPKEISGGVGVAHGSGGSRRSTRSRNIKIYQQKRRASRVPLKHPDKEQHYFSGALENHDGEGLKIPVTPIQSQSLGQKNTLSNQLFKNLASEIDPAILCDGVEKSIPTSKSPEEALGGHEGPFPDDECHASKEIAGGVNVAHNSCSNRRITRSHSIKVCQQQKCASRVPLKHTDKEQHSSLGALENLDGEGLKSPATPIQSKPLGQVNTVFEKLVKNSASRVSKPLSRNSEGCSKEKKVTDEAKATTRKRKMTGFASAVKHNQERDVSPLIKGGKEKISTVSPLSSSVRKSRSGRLLLPPLEFWRNQIPIYNADHEITKIQEAASLDSPFKVLHHH